VRIGANGILRRVVAEIREHTAEIAGQPVFWRAADGASPTPIVYLHGVPTNSDDWVRFLERGGGVAPDLPGFGRSGKRGDGDFTMHGYDRWLEAFLAHLEIDRFRLLVHDWGAFGLLLAQRFPERIERLVVMNAVPLLPGYRWHRIARVWRTRGAGEVFMGLATRPGMRFISRESNATRGPLPPEWVDTVMDHFDQGTQRAILRLYRTAPEDELARAGAQLGRIDCPALVAWGDQDPYIPARFADDYAAALGSDAEVLHVPDAGHWPWIDRPDLVATVVDFLSAA
jgi:pimeloyl-ACP methyl ester carboxylesterase